MKKAMTRSDEIRELVEAAYNAAKRRGDMKKDKDPPGSYREQMIDAGRGHLLRDED